MLPVFLSRSQSNSWLKVALTLLGMRHILQQDHLRAIHNTDNNSKAHCHLQEKPCFFQQSFAIWLIYHSAWLEQQCQELTSLSAALCYWSYQIVCVLVLKRLVFFEEILYWEHDLDTFGNWYCRFEHGSRCATFCFLWSNMKGIDDLGN